MSKQLKRNTVHRLQGIGSFCVSLYINSMSIKNCSAKSAKHIYICIKFQVNCITFETGITRQSTNQTCVYTEKNVLSLNKEVSVLF